MFKKDNYQIEIDQIDRKEWSLLLQEFDDASLYQTWSYGAVRWGEKNLSHIILKQNGQVVGAAQVIIKRMPLIRAGVAQISWGPLWKRKGCDSDREIFAELLSVIDEEYGSKRGLLIKVNPAVIENDNNSGLTTLLKNKGYQRNGLQAPYRTLLVDLRPSLEEIRKNLDQKWRNQLNRAEKNNLEVLEGSEDRLYAIFKDLQEQMLRRKNYNPGVDYEEFRKIQNDLPESLKMKIIICLSNGEPVTATIVSLMGDTGIYLLGATGDQGMNLKGAYLAQWLMIGKMKNNHYEKYDLGGIDLENNPGVYHFKSGLSGKEVLYIGEYYKAHSLLSDHLGRLLKLI
jgi:lipid II:glycine glycyltransferase (peptidoglycan interpeptide bridge formation enzyme)